MKSDTNFEFVRVTLPDGEISGAFLYKPQMILCTSFITMELARELGWKVESNMEKNDSGVISIVIEADKDKDRKE